MFSQERQGLWLPKYDSDLKDPSTWSSPPLVLLHDIHDGLLVKYDWKDSVSPPDQPGTRARPARDSQDGVSQEEVAPLFLPRTDSMRLLHGERTIPTMSSSRPSTGSRSKSSHGDNRFRTSRRDFRSRGTRNSFAFKQFICCSTQI